MVSVSLKSGLVRYFSPGSLNLAKGKVMYDEELTLKMEKVAVE